VGFLDKVKKAAGTALELADLGPTRPPWPSPTERWGEP